MDGNVAAVTNQTHNPALTVWFNRGRKKKKSMLSHLLKGVTGRSGLRLWLLLRVASQGCRYSSLRKKIHPPLDQHIT